MRLQGKLVCRLLLSQKHNRPGDQVLGEYVGVDPERVARAATELERLRDTLAANVPVIVTTLSLYWQEGTGFPVNLSSLRQAKARSVEDAADMRSRADLAAAFMANPVNIDAVASGMAWIPWSGPALDQADAKLEAQRLVAAQALAARDPATARADLAAIARDLMDHSADTGFLRAFWSQPGVAAAAAGLPDVLRTTQDGTSVKAPSKADLQNVLTVLASAAIPLGFATKDAYFSFNATLMNGLAKAGYPNAVAVFQGSSVTGKRFETGEAVGDNPSDYDVGICDPDLYSNAQALGIELKNMPARTAPISETQADELGLGDLQRELTGQAGRDVNFVIYQNVQEAQGYSPSLRVPFAYQIQNYFTKQAQRAATIEASIEIEQVEAAEQEEIAEAEAEAEAMAMDDDE